MDIELEIGQTLKISGVLCQVVKSRKCSDCQVQKATAHKMYNDGSSKKCGTAYGGNTSNMNCAKDTRADKTNVIFKAIK